MSNLEQSKENPELIDIISITVDYMQILKKMWKQVLLLGVLAAVLFYIKGVTQYQPYYTASATFTINISGEAQNGILSSSSYFDNSTAEQMAKTFPYILTSSVLKKQVAEDMGLEVVPGQISASVVEGTNLFTISVTDTDAERAYLTVQSVVENYPALSEAIIGKVKMEMLDETGIPTSPDNSQDGVKDIIKGAVVGLLIGFLWAAIVMVSRRTIRREEECPKKINKKCLGVVPWVAAKRRTRKVEKHLNILDEKCSPEFCEAFRIIRNKMERSARENGLKSILVTSTMGSEGKSTVAVNLALALAQEEKNVILIDCDLRHPSDNKVLGIDCDKGLAECLRDEIKLNECLYTAADVGLDSSMNFLFIPGGQAVSDATELLECNKMGKIIKTMEETMDYVILDSAPIGLLTDASILSEYADGAVYVVKNDYAKADHILEGMEHLSENQTYIIGCVLNG